VVACTRSVAARCKARPCRRRRARPRIARPPTEVAGHAAGECPGRPRSHGDTRRRDAVTEVERLRRAYRRPCDPIARLGQDGRAARADADRDPLAFPMPVREDESGELEPSHRMIRSEVGDPFCRRRSWSLRAGGSRAEKRDEDRPRAADGSVFQWASSRSNVEHAPCPARTSEHRALTVVTTVLGSHGVDRGVTPSPT